MATIAGAGAGNTRTVNAASVSLVAAHGITQVTAQTWWPELVRTPRVLVPIELDVLMVRNPNLSWAQTAMTVPTKPAPPGAPVAASTLAAPLFTALAPRPTGAYLQWYLPRAFTTGNSNAANNQAVFPPIPDRWLVLRISQGSSALRRSATGWVLEAGGQPATSSPLQGWMETGAAPNVQNPLNALGHGDLSWAGYFDNVENRLSFYDALRDDQSKGPLAYLVCGWFSDPTADPLGNQNITSYAVFTATLQQLGWTLDSANFADVLADRISYSSAASQAGLTSMLDPRRAATLGITGGVIPESQPFWSTACVLHGSVVGIDWPGNADTVEVGGPPAANSVRVAFGNTMAETMGAVVASANNSAAEAQIVEALQLGVFRELDQPNGRVDLDVEVHANSFATLTGGKPGQEPLTIAPSGPPVAPPANPATPGPGVFAQHTESIFKPIAQPIAYRVARPPGVLKTSGGTATYVEAETNLVAGRLQSVVTELELGVTLPQTDPGGDITAQRAAPRFYAAKDPLVLVIGGKRAFTHDSTVQTQNGLVVCRLTPVSELSWQMPGSANRLSLRGEDILEQCIENGSVPVECDGLLQETALLDTGSASAMAATAAAPTTAAPAGTFDQATAVANIQVEQTAWYALRQPSVDHGPLLAQSGIVGNLPATFAVSPAAQPWTPMHLDWMVEFDPSPNGDDDWTLDEIDYVLGPKSTVPAAGSGIVCQGRSPVTGGASNAISSAVANAISQAASVAGTGTVPIQQPESWFSTIAQMITEQLTALGLGNSASGLANGQLTDIATALSQMDVLSCGLDGLMTQLRGGVPGDGVSTPSSGTPPNPFFAMRAGFLRIKRLRLVDGFGQYLDLCGSSATENAQGYLISAPLTVNGQAGVLGLPPRFSAPVRASFRYMNADQPGVEADYETSPLCGFLMPNHLEGSIECFNADGSGAGSLEPAVNGGIAWETAPGIATGAGQDPLSSLENTYMAQMAQGLIAWGIADIGQKREPALGAVLRTIDSTLWTTDPFAHQGDEHLALLLGHPVCVMRALLRLDVNDTVLTPDNTVISIPVRLGNLTEWVDGLLGYYVNDDYTKLYVADAAAGMARQVGPGQGFLQQINLVPGFYNTFADDIPAGASAGSTPVTHPYVDRCGILWIRPNQNINLTLLVEPLTTVHCTTGLAPRKEIGMRREWVTAGLAAIAPTFRFGPVLVDPQHIRMPLATDLQGTWVWAYRSAAATWAENPATNATDDALLSPQPPTATEGWLKLQPPANARPATP